MSRSGRRSVWWLTAAVLGMGFGALAGPALAGQRVLDERAAERVEAMILRVKPAVVGILTDVRAEVTIRCGKNEIGSGYSVSIQS